MTYLGDRNPPPATVEAVELIGRAAHLVPMEPHHAGALFEAGRDEEIWRYMPQRVSSLGEMRDWVRQAVEDRERGVSLPFVILRRDAGTVAGSTRFIDIDLKNRNLEIGWTWLAPEARRTAVNTECKLMLLGHCFETLGMIRVMLKTDGRNLRSQTAIERLGAVKEGVLRHHRIMPDGFLRNSVVYSILAEEWPAVKSNLEMRLDAHGIARS